MRVYQYREYYFVETVIILLFSLFAGFLFVVGVRFNAGLLGVGVKFNADFARHGCNVCAALLGKPQIYANLRKPHALRACSNFETSSLVNREPMHPRLAPFIAERGRLAWGERGI